jgi:hypothetical protein
MEEPRICGRTLNRVGSRLLGEGIDERALRAVIAVMELTEDYN